MSSCDTMLRARKCPLSAGALPECFARVRAADLRDAQRQSARLRAEAGRQGCTVFVDIEVLVDPDAGTAMWPEQLGQTSSAFGSALRYAGTPRGLAGFIADLHTLGIADGVTLLPLRAADNADRIINDASDARTRRRPAVGLTNLRETVFRDGSTAKRVAKYSFAAGEP